MADRKATSRDGNNTYGNGNRGKATDKRSAGRRAPDVMDRVAPNNIDAEQGLLASCIMDGGGEVMTSCIEAKLTEDYFFNSNHQIIFQALKALYEQTTEVDEIILVEKLTQIGQLEEVGGYGAITRLTNRIETTAHAHYWLNIIREKYLLRRLISTSMRIIDRCYTGQDDIQQLLEQAEQEIFTISQNRISDSAKTINRSVDEAVRIIQAIIQHKGQPSGVPSGFIDLDKLTFGFHKQEMIVVAARPSVGKTSLAMNIAEHIVFPQAPNIKPVPTLVFSLEMSAEQLAMRLLCSHARVNIKKIRDNFINAKEQQQLGEAAQALKGVPLWIDDAPQVSILELRAKARRIHAKSQLGLVIIDYLQLISGTDSRTPREQQIAEISRGVKAMAKELDLPVIVLSQLNRESEREKRVPRLSDLRESGSIEQDADVVILLAKEKGNQDEEESGKRKLIVAKQRNGPIGSLNLAFLPDLTRFENFTQEAF